jgi:hypothetical protein
MKCPQSAGYERQTTSIQTKSTLVVAQVRCSSNSDQSSRRRTVVERFPLERSLSRTTVRTARAMCLVCVVLGVPRTRVDDVVARCATELAPVTAQAIQRIHGPVPSSAPAPPAFHSVPNSHSTTLLQPIEPTFYASPCTHDVMFALHLLQQARAIRWQDGDDRS